MPWIPVAIGAALGAGAFASKKIKAAHQNELASETARYSPWTGLTPSQPDQPNLFGDLGQGAALGGMVGGMMGEAKVDNAAAGKKDYLGSTGPVSSATPYSSLRPSQSYWMYLNRNPDGSGMVP